MTASPTALLALAAECEAAEGADRDLDARVWVALYPDDWLVLFGTVGNQDYVINSIEGETLALPPLTASVDAALGLALEMLPDWALQTWSEGAARESHLMPPNDVHHDGYRSHAPTLPLAIVAAMLRAVAARGDG